MKYILLLLVLNFAYSGIQFKFPHLQGSYSLNQNQNYEVEINGKQFIYYPKNKVNTTTQTTVSKIGNIYNYDYTVSVVNQINIINGEGLSNIHLNVYQEWVDEIVTNSNTDYDPIYNRHKNNPKFQSIINSLNRKVKLFIFNKLGTGQQVSFTVKSPQMPIVTDMWVQSEGRYEALSDSSYHLLKYVTKVKQGWDTDIRNESFHNWIIAPGKHGSNLSDSVKEQIRRGHLAGWISFRNKKLLLAKLASVGIKPALQAYLNKVEPPLRTVFQAVIDNY